MEELKDLERLRDMLKARMSMGFFLDGDAPFADLMIRSREDRKSHMSYVQGKFQTAISRYPKKTAEIRLEALLEALSSYWNDVFPLAEDLEMSKSTVQRRLDKAKACNITIPEEAAESVPPVPSVPHVGQTGQALSARLPFKDEED